METSISAQRRQISVLVCDLVGSTQLTERLDLEDIRAFITVYLQCCRRAVEDSGGFVARFTGDGVLAYFGYPLANEDDAERAVRAAMLIQEAVARLPLVAQIRPEVRIGIATGPTVVGDLIGLGPAQEHLVVGRIPSLAARLESLAAPGGVVVSETTQALASGVFAFKDFGSHPLKGFAEPQPAWSLQGSLATAERFRLRGTAAATPLIGRGDELQALLAAFDRCVAGDGGVVGVIGEAGVGKSRLLHEFRRALDTDHTWLEGGSAQVFMNTPFYTLSGVVRHHLAELEAAAVESQNTCGGSHEPDLAIDEDLSALGELVGAARTGLAIDYRDRLDGQRDRFIDSLLMWLAKTSVEQPTVLVIEDLHWTDPSSLELLKRLVSAPHKLMVVCTSRDPLEADWSMHGNALTLRLQRLGPAAIRRIIIATAGAVPEGALRRLVSRAGGVPLFAEALARLVAEQRETSSAGQPIPDSLSDLLLGRLDKAGRARWLVQVAAVLGAEFRQNQLAMVAEMAPLELEAALTELARVGIIEASSLGAGSYGFRHALVQEAAEGSLLKEERVRLHRRAVDAIQQTLADGGHARPEILAQHWEGAGDLQAALEAWREAGRIAADQRAFIEAEHALQRAVALVDALGSALDDDGLALELQGALVSVLQVTHGYSATTTVQASERAEALVQRSGDMAAQMENALGAWMAASSAGNYDEATPRAARLVSLAKAAGSGLWQAVAHMAELTSRYRVGDLAGAEHAFTQGAQHFELAEFRGRPGALCQTYGNAGIIARIRGDVAGAQARLEQTLAQSGPGAPPYEMAFGSFMAGTLAALAGEGGEAERLAETAIEVSDAEGFPQFSATGRVLLGYALSLRGRTKEGVAQMQEGLERMRLTASRAGATMYLTWLGDAQLSLGEAGQASLTLERALGANLSERFYRPEILRLRSKILAHRGDIAAAKVSYAEAIAASRAIGAQLFLARATEELRAPAGSASEPVNRS